MKTLLPFLFVFIVYSAVCQTFNVYDIDYSDFPTMRAKFFVFDNDGKQLTNWKVKDFVVTENDEERLVTDVYCNVKTEPVKISSVLTIDVSGSMWSGNRLDIALQAATAWIKALPKGYSECAITTFESQNQYIQDFTTDEGVLISKVNSIVIGGGTSFDAAFINPIAGGLLVLEKAKYQKVMILMTDGFSSGHEAEIINKANTIGATVYCITLGCGCPTVLRNIAEKTGGMWFENVTTVADAKNIYLSILSVTQKKEPCILEWESGFTQCTDQDVDLEIEIPKMGLSAEKEYNIPKKAMARVLFKPSGVYFQNKEIGVQADTTIYIEALNNDMEVTDIILDNPDFKITPKDFSLLKGETQELTLSYTPVDSSYNMVTMDFVVNNCIIKYYSSGGFLGQVANERTLNVTHPNGGEVFVAGSDTIVTWEGVLESDDMTIEFSSNNGETWDILTEDAFDLSYQWKIDNDVVSDECLISVKQNLVAEQGQNSGTIEWTKSLGGSNDDAGYCIQKTLDGGYVIVGYSESNDGDVEGNKGLSDSWILKLDGIGNIQWQQCLGGSGYDKAYSVQQTINGGYIVAGYTNSSDGDLTNNKGDYDYWIMKLDVSGVIEWQRNLGGDRFDQANSIQETNDGGFIVAGYSNSEDGDRDTSYREYDYWVVKIDDDGVIEWTKTFGGSYIDVATSIKQTDDDGYIVAGYTKSYDHDVVGNKGWSDYWVVKMDKEGEIEWKKCFGGTDEEEAYDILQTKDRGFIIAGHSKSTNGEVFGNHGDTDYWIVKLDSFGIFQWQKCLGGTQQDVAYSIEQTEDEGYIIAGFTVSNDGDVKNFHGDYDYFVAKLNKMGKKSWTKCYGGSGYDVAHSIKQTIDGGYIVVGQSYSTNGNVSGNKGDGDLWVVKLFPDKIYTQADTSDAVFSIVKPEVESHDIDMGIAIVGTPKDSIITDFINNIGAWPCRIDKIYFTGADANFFRVNNPYPVYTVPENTAQWSEIEFSPNKVRHYEAKIVIVTQADTIIQNISGDGIAPHIVVVNEFIDFGKIYINDTKDTLDAMTIQNVGDMPVTITKTEHIYPNATDFTTIDGAGPFTLEPGEIHVMDLSFTAKTLGRTSGQLLFYHDKPGSPNKVTLFAEGYSTNTTDIKDIVFAQQPINTSKDSTLSEYFENTGVYENKIDTIFLKNNDADQFKINNPETPFYLLSDEVHDLEISFIPTSIGNKQTNLYMVCQMDTIVRNVIGEGIQPNIVVINPNIDFGRVHIGDIKDTLNVVTIANQGSLPVNISQVEISGQNADQFSILNGDAPFTLDPGDTWKMDLSHSADDEGNKVATLLFHHDAPGSPNRINLLALDYCSNTTSIEDIIFANQIVDVANDSTVVDYFYNSGLYTNTVEDIYLKDGDADQFEITNPQIPFSINSSEYVDLDIRFLPTSPGDKQTNLYMVCQGETLIRTVRGRGINLNIEMLTNSINYGTIELGQRVDSLRIPILVNKGSEELVLTQVMLKGSDVGDYEPGDGFNSATLQPDDTLFVDLTFNPQTEGTKISNIEIQHTNSPTSLNIDVRGVALDIRNPEINLSLPHISAKVGDFINIPIVLNSSLNMDKLKASGFDARIKFNSTVMYPVNLNAEVNQGEGTLSLINLDINSGDTLITIQFQTLLGNKETSNIEFCEFSPSDADLIINVENGSITITDLCEQGGTRLFNPDGEVGISSLSPNPAEDKLQITLDLLEKGETKLEIYNSIGKLAKVIIEENIQTPGERNINENIKDLPSGSYTIILTTPSYKQTKNLIIAR